MNSLHIAFKTQTGDQGTKTVDSFLYGGNLFIVLEGTGGEHLGDIAGERTCQLIYRSFFESLGEIGSPKEAMISALKKANEEILLERKRLGEKMAASVSVVYITDKIMYFTHLGDSRIYCLHKRQLNQLTQDHILYDAQGVAQGTFGDRRSPHALTEGLGIHGKPSIEIKTYLLRRNDLIIMTTDGLTRRISNREIRWFSSRNRNPEKLSFQLLEIARRKGGNGNMTLGLIRYGTLFSGRNRLVIASSAILLALAIAGNHMLKYRGVGPQEARSLGPQSVKKGRTEPTAVPVPDTRPPVKGQELKGMGTATAEPHRDSPPPKEGPGLEDLIYTFINDWKSAWERTAGENGDLARYMSFYADEFSSEGMDKNRWRQDKGLKGRKRGWIKIEVSDIQIYGPDARGELEVRFQQEYRSSHFTNRTNKVLQLKKVPRGWKIISEKAL